MERNFRRDISFFKKKKNKLSLTKALNIKKSPDLICSRS